MTELSTMIQESFTGLESGLSQLVTSGSADVKASWVDASDLDWDRSIPVQTNLASTDLLLFGHDPVQRLSHVKGVPNRTASGPGSVDHREEANGSSVEAHHFTSLGLRVTDANRVVLGYTPIDQEIASLDVGELELHRNEQVRDQRGQANCIDHLQRRTAMSGQVDGLQSIQAATDRDQSRPVSLVQLLQGQVSWPTQLLELPTQESLDRISRNDPESLPEVED